MNFGRVGIAAAGLLAVMAMKAPASAQEANGFGEKGQLILSADRLVPLFSYTRYSTTTTNGASTTTDSTSNSSLSFLFGTEGGSAVGSSVHTIPRVAFDITVIPRLTIGGAVVIGLGLGGTRRSETVAGSTTTTTEIDAPKQTVFGFAPRVGYILPLGDVLAFWPRGGFAFYSATAKQDVVNGNPPNQRTDTISATTSVFSLDLDPQLVIVPIKNVFFNVGPLVNVPLSGTVSTKTVSGNTTRETSNDFSLFHMGISAGLGGWFQVF